METSKTRVCVRVRPSREEISLECESETRVVCSHGEDSSTFHFDQVLDSTATQSDVYRSVQSVVEGVLRGVNGTIITYGQTGGGKTHTLIGQVSEHDKGIVPRAARELLWSMPSDVYITISAVEIYCERLLDLLDLSNTDLAIKQDADNGVYIATLAEISVDNEEELGRVMQEGLANRTVSSTGMNQQSSRSHCIVFMRFRDRHTREVQLGKLSMVDLAGSERQSRTGATGVQLDEGILINKSLSALANVIYALTENKAHVPYRDSKLTRVLQDSIGGNSRTALLVCCSPAKVDLSETICSLRFGSRARGITNTVQPRAQVRQESLDKKLAECEAEVRRLVAELREAKAARATIGRSLTQFLVRFCMIMFVFVVHDYFCPPS